MNQMVRKIDKQNVVIIGPDLDVMGGISFVLSEYLKAGLNKRVDLTFIPTTKDCSKAKKVVFFLGALVRTLSTIVKIKDSIYHLHVSQDGSFYRKFIIFIIAKFFNKKVIVHIHGSKFEEFMTKRPLNKKLSHFMLAHSDVVIALTEQWKNKISLYVPNARVVKLYNPVSLPSTNSIPSNNTGRVRILFLGRLSQRKGTYDLLRCINSHKSFFLNHKAKFILAGDGDIDKVNVYVTKNQINELVEVPGWISGDQKNQYLSTADIYVLPSYNEQMPMSILEAMSFGLPVISTCVAGIPEMVNNGKTGILISPGDITGLRSALEDLIMNPEIRKSMGIEGRATASERFEASVIVEQLVEIYREVLATNPKTKNPNTQRKNSKCIT